MRIWKKDISIESLTRSHANTAVALLGIEFLDIGDDTIRARVPVDHRTVQPYGIRHGVIAPMADSAPGRAGRSSAA